MEQKRTLILVIGALSAAQMAIARTADALAGLHQASQRLAAKMDEIAVAELEFCPCPDIPPLDPAACYGGGGFEAEFYCSMGNMKDLMQVALLPREIPKLAEMEPRQQHEPPVFRGYMNARDTRRKRW